MNWYKSQVVATSVLAGWNIGVIAGLGVALLWVVLANQYGAFNPIGATSEMLPRVAILAGSATALYSGRWLVHHIPRLGPFWGTMLLLVLIRLTFELSPTKFLMAAG